MEEIEVRPPGDVGSVAAEDRGRLSHARKDSRNAEPGQYARTQAVFQTVQTAIQIVGALAGGALFTLSPAYAFLSIAVVCVLGALTGMAPRALVAGPAHQSS